MVLKIQTEFKKCEVELTIYAQKKEQIRIVGFDKFNERYFDRNVDVLSNPTILRFGCPIAPETLFIKCVSTNGNQVPLKLSAKLNSVKDSIIWSEDVREYCEFIKEFCKNIKLYPAKKDYTSVSGKYKIKHSPYILDSNGGKSVTPARIHKTQHFIEISNEWFTSMTIPMRVFVLTHEFSHVYLNSDPLDEHEADLNGAKLYLKMGFPVIELIYSFTKIFGDSPETRNRAQSIINYLKQTNG